jgi:hypothetical protein
LKLENSMIGRLVSFKMDQVSRSVSSSSADRSSQSFHEPLQNTSTTSTTSSRKTTSLNPSLRANRKHQPLLASELPSPRGTQEVKALVVLVRRPIRNQASTSGWWTSRSSQKSSLNQRGLSSHVAAESLEVERHFLGARRRRCVGQGVHEQVRAGRKPPRVASHRRTTVSLSSRPSPSSQTSERRP